LKKALKDGNIVYLTQVLNSYPYHNDEKAVKLILKTLSPKASPDVQIAILYWIGNQKVTPAVSRIPDYLNTSDKDVQKAAVYALSKIGGEPALLSLVGLLKSSDENAVMLAKEALVGYAGDISAALSSVFDDCGKQGKIVVLQLIANRRLHDRYRLVYNQLFTDDEPVKTEAAKTLRYVVTEENLPELFELLEQTDDRYLASIQQAVNAALSLLSPEEQMKQVMEKMNASDKKYAYYVALANSGTPQALDLIMKAYQTETGKNKQAAFDAIKQWKSFDALYALQDIARSSKDKGEITQAVDAIIEKVASSNKTGAVKYLFLRNAMEMAQTVKQKNDILRLLGTTDMYQAMLFVAPYMDDPVLSESAAQAAMNIALNNPSFAGSETTAILNKVSKTLNNPDADYQRQSIRKYLSENPTTGGFVSLFNGKDLEGWKGLVGNPITRAKMSEKELAEAQVKADREAFNDWKVVDGTIVFDGKGFNNLCTVKQYGDFELLVDWKLFPGPEPDAGIYLRGTPQVQIWDTSRVDVGAQVGSGGLYNNQVNPSKPLKVADLKVGEWNTFRIRMIGDRVSVWLNGELVTDNVILENYWDRNLPIFPIEQIELQAHGSKVTYRDIYIKEFERPEPFRLSEEEEKEGFRVLFDGTHMHEWTGNTKDYVLEDGNIVMHPSKSFGGNLYTKDEFDNFVLRFEFMLTPGANNGLGIRTPMEGDAAYVGMELQILDNEAPIYKDLQPYQYHGSVYGVIPAKRGYLKPTGEWNYQEVIADGDHIKVILNGTTILDGNIREAAKNGTMDHKDHPGLFNKKGHIGFLGHGSEVKFRNIRIKELKN
jgi:HEAT repeat protein